MMKGRFLVNQHQDTIETNIYADKSALILAWLLIGGFKNEEFSLRQVAIELGVSVGLVQRVFVALIKLGILETKGLRTAKKFILKKPKNLLKGWLEHYSIVKKCKIRTYHSGFQGKAELLRALNKSKLDSKVTLALHSSAEALGYKNTNLKTLELYLLDTSIRAKLEDALLLEPQERGYEVLLIEPYYKSLLNRSENSDEKIKISSALLTFLDLYHFPLRGQEQAEFMAERIPELKRIYKNN